MEKQDSFPVLTPQVSDSEYAELWRRCGPIRIEMIEKAGKCEHVLGDAFFYRDPYVRPQGVCTALLHVLDLYLWRVALGFPSWEKDDRRVYRVHCPSKTGTVWEMKRVDQAEQ
jgi:uncharacterized repeat protein (TIGR04076 family)